jgi:hypothetical protein
MKKMISGAILTVVMTAYGQQGISVGISPVPIYPSDGRIGPEFKDEYLFLDPQTLDLVAAYPTGPGGVRTVVKIERPNHVRPNVTVKVSGSGGIYQYQYTIANDPSARQPIHSVYIPIPQPDTSDPLIAVPPSQSGVPAGWTKMDYSYRPGQWAIRFDRQAPAVRNIVDQIALSLESSNKPGLGEAFFEGELSTSPSLAGLPEVVLKKLALFQQPEFSSVPVMTTLPKFDPRTAKVKIAMDFSFQLQRLRLRMGESLFIKGALDQISQFLAQPHPEDPVAAAGEAFPEIKQKPEPEVVIEEQAYEAMRLALGF